MRIESFTLYKYSLPLKQPLYIYGVELMRREGLIIQITAPDGAVGFGEVVPLTGRSQENLNEAYAQLQFLKVHLKGQEIPEGVEKLDGRFASWLEGIHLQPSVQFGIEMAVLNLIANARSIPLFKLISESGHDHIKVNGYLDGPRHDVVQEAKRLKENGFKSMKLKVRGPVEDNVIKVKAVHEVLQGEVLLHLDANQFWNLEEAIIFGRDIEDNFISYIEEPLRNVYQTPEFYKETTIPVALDESLLRLPFDELKAIEGVDVLVLKPTVLGGLERTWKIIQQAKEMGLETVISSTFESGLGLLTLANFSGCTSRDYAAGLDTLKWFRYDLLKDPLVIGNGKIDISQRLVGQEDVNFSYLKEII